ncbi:sorbosone dehydrogenase family protein [Tahibacter sp. P2K]|uniref:Sorbosone dehydrogenase family protein n=1 Tax=Tahibacter harae TaxID=2963937 RepID=A0ABT1QWZ2_9GAMM|nr:sorbosone dehydrogenase family protein [Tahibacter harae]MCQ4166808.1 sorbosone dehydrogenase family protein [Tahibacter harae]
MLLALPAAAAQAQDMPAGYGPDPELPEPDRSLIPVVDIAPATGWSGEAKPRAAAGLSVQAFARGLDHPRWLYVLPNGDVLVAETNAPPDSRATKGIKGTVMKSASQKAGAAVPSPNRITLLRDADGDGTAEQRSVLLQGLSSPFGMTLVDGSLYVANADSLVRYAYRAGETQIGAAATKVAELPHGPGPLNHHWTKSLLASKDGKYLYVGVGSNSNIAEGGIDKEGDRARILQIDRVSGETRPYATGLRNPVGLDWEPHSGALWAVVNERDELGNDLVPDYLTAVRDGAFYGWPYSYFGAHVDKRVEPQQPELVAKTVVPDYALGAHTASLGLAFNGDGLLAAPFGAGAFIGQHGSWNRKPPSGYKVIFVPFSNGKPSGVPRDVLGGFLDDKGNAQGRPVGVALDRKGALLVADDVGNVIWRVTPAAK